jgi:CO dehydrogenase maturation factor
VALLVLGAIEGGGSGCACPENVFIRSLIADLVLFKDEAVVMDMEPGVEHLGRATASGVDTMIVVVEPGQRSMDSARRITSMAGEIGLKKIRFVANKITGDADRKFVEERVGPGMLAGMIPYCEELRRADRDGTSVLDGIPGETAAVFAGILDRLTER